MRGAGMGVLCSLGALPEQVPHLLHMGLEVGDAEPERHDPTTHRHPLLRIEGTFNANDRWEQRTAMERVMLDGLYDLSAERAHAVERHLADTPCLAPDVDQVTAELLTRLGMSIPWLRLLAATVDDAEISTGGELEPAEVVIERARGGEPACISITLGDNVWWMGDRVCLGRFGPDLPRSIMIAAQGRPLRDVVSHPVLDRHDIVTGVVEHERFLTVRHVPTPLRMAA
jgi:hypothetical protein